MDIEKANAYAGNYLSELAVDRAMDKWRAERQAQEAAEIAEAEANKPIWEKVYDLGSSAVDNIADSGVFQSIGNTIKAGGEFAYNSVNDAMGEVKQLGQDFRTLQSKSADLQKAMLNGDMAQIEASVGSLQQAGQEFTQDIPKVIMAPSKQAVRMFVNSYADNPSSPYNSLASSIRQSDAYVKFHMTKEEHMQKSKEIEELTGIPAEVTSVDDEAFKAALKVYDYMLKNRDIGNVWEEFPEIKGIADKSPNDAALALYDINTSRTTKGVIESASHAWDLGLERLEYNNLQFKIALGQADEADKQRAEVLKKSIETAEKKKAPSMLDDPLSAMAAGVAQSAPEMGQGAAMALALTALTGGTGLLATAGGLALKQMGGAAIKSILLNEVKSEAWKTVAKRLIATGMWSGMGISMYGSDYAELGQYKDKDGNPLFTEAEKRQIAAPQAAVEAGIETASDIFGTGVIKNAIMPKKHLERVAQDIIANTAANKTARDRTLDLLGDRGKDWLKMTAAETAEEGLQSVSNDIFTNYALESKGDAASHIQKYSASDIFHRSIASMLEAVPGAMGFATIGAGGSLVTNTGYMARQIYKEQQIARQYGENMLQTINGTIMVEQLQGAVASGKLKETAPDVQQKILREQLKDTGYEIAYIDVETALQKDTGVQDLQKVAEAAGMTKDQLDTAIEEKGYISVPVEVLSQVGSTPDLLDSVSFKREAESMARMRLNQKELQDAYQEALKATLENKKQLIDNVIDQILPNPTKEQREMLETAIKNNPANPAQGYKQLKKELRAELDEILAPALKALQEGMGKAGLMDVEDEQGNTKTIRYTENDEWYRNFYQQFKRKPTKAELEDMAIAMTIGDPSAPKVAGWVVDSLEMQQAMEQNKGTIDRLTKNLQAVKDIRDAVEPLTGVEMQLTEGLTPEGFRMYHQLYEYLKSVGGATARQARMGAILAARHADIYAAKVTARTGKKYTAADYMRDKIGFSAKRAAGALNQLAGVKAYNANIEQLKTAKEMFAEGTDMDEIYNETGWLRGADGKWRFEIPDNLDKINWQAAAEKPNGVAALWQVYDNDKLYEAYPMLASVPVKLVDMAEGNNGRVTGNVYRVIEINHNLPDDAKNETLVHEIQHLIQEKEGFATGGNMQQVRQQIQKQIDSLRRKLAGIPQAEEYIRVNDAFFTAIESGSQESMDKAWEEQARLEEEIPESTRNEIDNLSLHLRNLEKVLQDETDDYRLYRNLAGEQEARSTATRATYMTEYKQAVQEQTKAQLAYEQEVKKQPREMVEKLRELQQLENKIGNGITDEEEARIEKLRQEIDPALLDAYDERDSANWIAEDRKEYLDTPVPHDENAIVVFDGQETAIGEITDYPEEILNQRAWHGSPYDFETFDLGAIGTGEGAQVHGWGLYFAGNREVSKHYQDLLSGNYQTITIGRTKYKPDDYYNLISKKGKNVRDLGKEYVIASKSLLIEKDNDKSIKILNDIDEEGEMLYGEWITKEDGIKAAELIQKGKVKTEKSGKLFEVEIPDNDVLLDEQKPFSEQPEKVQQALRKLISESETAKKHSAWAEQIFDSNGKKIYGIVTGIAEGDVPKGTDVSNIQKLGSELLNKYGVKGITYEGGTDGRCYVVFDDEAIEVIDKFNQAVARRQVYGQTKLMSDGKRIVSLLEGANESTFMHEMAHVFLYDLEDLAQIDDVSAKELEIVKNWAEWKKGMAAEYKGMDQWEGIFAELEQEIIDAEAAGDYDLADKKKREWMHERFARGFELYLKDGHAPAKGLKAVFRAFKQFLRQLYAAFVSDGGSPSVPVRRVMDRMIATEQEIEAAELEDRYTDVLEAGGEKLYDEKEEDTYLRWDKEADEEAKEKLLKIVMKDLEKEKQAEFESELAKERENYLDLLRQETVYVAEQAVLKSGDENIVKNWYPSVEAFREELASTPPMEEALENHMKEFEAALDARLIESHLSEEAVEKAMKSSKYRAKLAALKGKAMAKKLGLINKINAKAEKAMASLEDKLTALPEDTDLQVDKFEDGVKAVMKEINKLRYSAKWSAEDLANIESMINSATKEELQKKLADFKASSKQEKITEEEIMRATEGRQETFREMARAAMASKPIHESCYVGYYIQQEKKAARRVRDMLRAKRYDMAMAAQNQQALYSAMVEMAEENKAEKDKLLAQTYRDLNARSVRLPKDERYWHRQLAYVLRIIKDEPQTPESGVVPLHVMIKNMEGSFDILEGSLNYIQEIASRGEKFQGFQELTMDEFRHAVESLHMIYVVGRDKFKMKTIQGKSLLDVVDEMTTEEGTIASNIDVDTRAVNPDRGGVAYSEMIGNLGDTGHLVAKMGQDYIVSQLKPENILEMIGSAAHRYIYGTLEKAAEAEARMQAANIEALRKIMSVYSREEKQEWNNKVYDLSTEKGDKVSKMQIMCMALNWGNLSNRQRLLGGLAYEERTPEAVAKLTKEVMDLFHETMTERDWNVIQQLWDHTNSFWDDTVKVEEELNGLALEKIPPTPFTITSSDGVEMHLAGGYMPVKYDPTKSSRAAEQDINEMATSIMAGASRLGIGRSFTKSRSEFDIYRPLVLDFSVLEDHYTNVIHNATYRLPIRDVLRLVTNLQFENYVANSLGREYHKVLKDWAVDAWKRANPDINTADNILSKGLGTLRRNSTMAIMGFRPWPAIENISNIAVVAEQIGTGEMMSAIADFYANRTANMNLVMQRSLFMRNRLENMDRDIRSQPGVFRAGNVLAEFAREHAYDMLVATDLAVSAPLWLRAYKDAYEPQLDAVKAENEANIAYVIECQQKVDELKAQITDLTTEAGQMDEHLKARRFANPDTAETLRQSPFAIHTDSDLRALAGENRKRAKELEKERWQAEVAFHEAQQIKILTDDEIVAEAENRAVFVADRAIRDTFGSGRTIDLPAVQRSTNEITKLLTTFYGFFNTQWNAIFMHYARSKHLPSTSAIYAWMPFARGIMFRFVLTALIGSALQYGLGLAGSDDDDKKRKVKGADGKTTEEEVSSYERFLKVFGKNILSTSAGSMYLIRDVMNVAMDFVINDKTYGLNVGSVASRGPSEFGKMVILMAKKGEKDAEIQAQQEKREREHQEKLAKLTGKKRQEYLKKWEEDQQYVKPPKRITYTEIAGHGLKSLSSMTAANTGVTSTLVNAVTSTMQYLLDTDMRYDPTWKNIIWSALFDKKPVEREIPKKPPAEPKKKKKKSE